MSKYEDYFEGVRDRSVVISDLIEQIILVEEVIARHREAGSEGFILGQYIDRKNEFSEELNSHLDAINLKIVEKLAA